MNDASFCQAHWDRLRTEIDNQGLNRFTSNSGIMVCDKLNNWYGGQYTEANFEPLMLAHNRIITVMLENYGKYEGCPLCCIVEARQSEIADDCLTGSVGDLLGR